VFIFVYIPNFIQINIGELVTLYFVSFNHQHLTYKNNISLHRPTANEHELASRLANAIDKNDQYTIDGPLAKPNLNHKSKPKNNLILHYTHEARLATYKPDIHQLWNRIITTTPAANTKLIVGNRNNCNMKRTLVHRRPHQNKHR